LKEQLSHLNKKSHYLFRARFQKLQRIVLRDFLVEIDLKIIFLSLAKLPCLEGLW